ncbi:MAG TPA: PTS sugar transporter subunit IIA [Candidatus Didemnitutus sp.]|nr:PTS sugar transporter subunit IIA [Candidatus Didemnitutus sp.]
MHEPLTLDEVASYLRLEPRHVERLVREGNIPHARRGGRLVFTRGEIDAWASQRLLGLPHESLEWYHQRTLPGANHAFADSAMIPALMKSGFIDLELPARTKASVLAEMAALAARTGRVLDVKALQASLEAREALSSTALPGGFALLHGDRHHPFVYEGSLIVLGRTIQAVHFGAPDHRPTRLFFLIACEDAHIHLHVLARLSLLALRTNLMARLWDIATAAEAYDLLVELEKSVLPPAS